MIFRPLMRAGTASLAVCLLLGGAAVAQTAPKSAQPAQPGQPPMVLPVISPSHLAAARAVVISSGLSRSFDTIAPDLMSQLYANVTQTRPELESDLKQVLAHLQPEFQRQTGQIVDLAAQAVAAQLSEDDLKQINAFFTSPAGKHYVEAQPAMLSRIVAAARGVSEQMSQRIMTRVRDELKKRGKQL